MILDALYTEIRIDPCDLKTQPRCDPASEDDDEGKGCWCAVRLTLECKHVLILSPRPGPLGRSFSVCVNTLCQTHSVCVCVNTLTGLST